MLKNRRQALRFCSSKCRRETIRCRWTLLLKLKRGFENQSKNRTLEWRDAITFTTQKPRNRTRFAQRLRYLCSIRAARFCCCEGRTTTNGQCRAEQWISENH